MITIKELKDKRDELWKDLDKLIPAVDAIRDQIKAIQQELFVKEMTPVMYTLEAEISAGKYSGVELEEKQAKLDAIKSVINKSGKNASR